MKYHSSTKPYGTISNNNEHNQNTANHILGLGADINEEQKQCELRKAGGTNITDSVLHQKKEESFTSQNEKYDGLNITSKKQQTEAICPRCNTRIPEKSSFCYKCGFKIIE